MPFLPVIKGLALMLSVIVAVGPQNAFLLRQAVRREHAWLVASIMLFGDVSMILLGGFGIVVVMLTLSITLAVDAWEQTKPFLNNPY